MTFSNSILSGETLVREAIQSEGFQSGVQGWRIERDGDAEFQDIIARGDITATSLRVEDPTAPLRYILINYDAGVGAPTLRVFTPADPVNDIARIGPTGITVGTAINLSTMLVDGGFRNGKESADTWMVLQNNRITAKNWLETIAKTLELNPAGGSITVNGDTAGDKVTIGAGAITASPLDINPAGELALLNGRKLVTYAGKVNLPSTAGITAETAIATFSVGDLTAADEVELMICIALRTLTAGDQYTLRVRRGNGLAGLAIHTAISDKTVGTNTNKYTHGPIFDAPGVVSGQQYTLSVQRFAGAGTITTGDTESFMRAHIVRS